ncbi:conserved hypothetical protein [Coccidioides posadasii str. Silveira]|uniref:Uncharacterized protein n=1 Tax=Coccidioides posadasii (strain RMSCC 757 / Silveira) TaxID=443226 RepID=E9DAJ0_COCPS|nr:conserved hypothetical protein [Coccidioides posadasii str. Silveira]
MENGRRGCEEGALFVDLARFHALFAHTEGPPETSALIRVHTTISGCTIALCTAFRGGLSLQRIRALCRSHSATQRSLPGYSSENKNIELLRLRSFTLNKQLRDEDLLGPEALDRIASIIGIMVPFVTYLNSVVMPDLDENEQNDDDEEPDGGSTSS